MAKLFQPIAFRNLEVRNRVAIAPMCQYSCDGLDGVVNEWHYVHYTELAKGGAGLIIAEASGVNAVGRITPWCAGIWNDEQVAAWARIADSVHGYGAKFGIQLAHAGRKASTHRPWSGSGSIGLDEGGWPTVSSTDQPFPGYASPNRLSTDEIDEVVNDFASAAKKAVTAGFDLVEIHAAHGYLMHQFLSPLANDRTDEYGGSLENRARLLLRVVAAVRAVVGELPVLVRFSATDWLEGGFTPEECATVAAWCESAGVDGFDISSGGITMPAPIPAGPGYQVPLAETVAAAVSVPVGAVGFITTPEQAEQILEEGKTAFILIARAALANPHWPALAASKLGASLDFVPKQYQRAVY